MSQSELLRKQKRGGLLCEKLKLFCSMNPSTSAAQLEECNQKFKTVQYVLSNSRGFQQLLLKHSMTLNSPSTSFETEGSRFYSKLVSRISKGLDLSLIHI